MPHPARLNSPTVIAALLALGGLAATLIGYAPGIMTWDSVRQYDQALSGRFDDWHPPAMEWLWRQLVPIHQGPMPMLLVQLALFWAGMAMLIAWARHNRRPWLGVALVGCALMPISLALMGAVLKDCLMTGAIVAACGIMALVSGSTRRHLGWRALGIALLVAASTLRFNAFMATVPIALALTPPAWRDRAATFATATIILSALMIAALPVANRMLHAEKSGVELSLVIFDLGGITQHSGVDAFPPLDAVTNPVAASRRCYTPLKWDSYSWWVAPLCPIEFYGIQDWFADHKVNAELFWVKAILAHPIAYAEHRLAHFNIATRFVVHDESEVAGQIEDAPNVWGYKIARNVVTRTIEGGTWALSHTPLEWPIVFIGLAIGALAVAPSLPSARLIAPLAASSAIYGLGYLLVSVASEIRYHFWTMLGAAFATAFVIADVAGGARVSRRHAVLAYAPFAIITVLAILWRIMPA